VKTARNASFDARPKDGLMGFVTDGKLIDGKLAFASAATRSSDRLFLNGRSSASAFDANATAERDVRVASLFGDANANIWPAKGFA
jgi:hypothetical protein